MFIVKDGENPNLLKGKSNEHGMQWTRIELENLDEGQYFIFTEMDLSNEYSPGAVDSAVNIYCN